MNHRVPRLGLSVLLSLLVAVPLLAQAPPAAALTDRWAAWAPITGDPNAYATVLRQRAPGFPEADVASDSRGNVQLAGGSSVFLGASTPPGAKYGSSKGSPYLVLRPQADTATTPSTTTYTFADPTPDTGWAFVLGDIDSDKVRVRATDEDGEQVPRGVVDSWFRGAFNHAGGSDRPTWDAADSTLVGNPGALDTDGASGWFEPDVRLTSLTFVFTRRAGFPVYQTWFVSRARPVGGTVADLSGDGRACPVEDAVVTLVSPYGEEVRVTNPEPDGTYSFGEVATQAGYTVRLAVPDTCVVLGPAQLGVSTRGEDGDEASRADFDVREVVPEVVRGTVRDADGRPVPGAEVTLVRPGGGTVTTTTGPDGGYLFDDNRPGTGYEVVLTVPPGYGPGPDGTRISGITIASDPVVDQDFVVVAPASVSGTVTGGGAGVGGVRVVVTPAGGGPPITAVTRGDGSYVVDGVPPGDYTITVDPPPGYDAPPGREVTVGSDDVTGQDFALTRPGAIGGQVTDVRSDDPLADVRVVVDGPGRPIRSETDDTGRYFVEGLPAGEYDVTVTPPDGGRVVGADTASATITAAGEVVSGLDFVIRTAAAPTQPPTTSPPTGSPTGPPAPPTGPGDGTPLPEVGGPPTGLLVGGVVLLLAGAGLLAWSVRRRRA